MDEDSVLACNPCELYMALDTGFSGERWLEWEPETVLMSIDRSGVSEPAIDKILAVHAVASNTSLALSDWRALEKVTMAFCNNVCVMDVDQPPYVEELLYAVRQIRHIAMLVHGDSAEGMTFHGAVPQYVAAVAKFRGWFVLPDELSFAQPDLDRLCGISDGSAKRTEHENIVREASKLARELKTRDAERMLKSESVSALSDDSPGALIAKRVIGSLLYDPTLPYKS